VKEASELGRAARREREREIKQRKSEAPSRWTFFFFLFPRSISTPTSLEKQRDAPCARFEAHLCSSSGQRRDRRRARKHSFVHQQPANELELQIEGEADSLSLSLSCAAAAAASSQSPLAPAPLAHLASAPIHTEQTGRRRLLSFYSPFPPSPLTHLVSAPIHTE